MSEDQKKIDPASVIGRAAAGGYSVAGLTPPSVTDGIPEGRSVDRLGPIAAALTQALILKKEGEIDVLEAVSVYREVLAELRKP